MLSANKLNSITWRFLGNSMNQAIKTIIGKVRAADNMSSNQVSTASLSKIDEPIKPNE